MPSLEKSPTFYCLGLIFLWTLLGWTNFSHGQTSIPFSNDTQQRTGQYRDTLRALIVFTTFKNDNYPGDPQVNHREWPLFQNPNELPSPANALLSPSPNPPYPDSSLTAYFSDQSLGSFILYGQAYDSVLVTQHNESRYHRPEGGYADLTLELLDRIDAYGFDFSKYDHNRDGFIDYVFIVLRGDSKRDSKAFAWTGASCLDGRCTGSRILDGGPKEAPTYDGKKLDWNKSGSYIIHRTPGNVSAFHYYIRLMAHEIGHDIWAKHFVHIPDYRSNDVPLNHNRGRSRDCVGYVLMAGSGGAWDCGGSETISAFERDLLGWIQCIPLTTTLRNVPIGDLYTTSSCYKIELSQSSTRLYLSNLQHKSYFDQQRDVGKEKQFQIGLRTSGLLVHLANKNRLDVIPADNDLALSPRHEPYQSDLFSPSTSTQLTPWTRPNSNGYTMYPPNFQPDWIAIDHIRESSSPDKTLVFDYYQDFRQQPVIREDSWMGQETSGHAFDALIQVTNQSTLNIDTDLTLKKGLSVHTGSIVRIGSQSSIFLDGESTLELRHGATLHIEGELILNGFLARSPGANIVVAGDGVIRSTRGSD